MKHHIFLTAILLITAAGLPANAYSASLNKKECAALLSRKASLVKAGASKNMAKGAKWAKKNLSEKAHENVKKLIEVSEQLLFRCGHKSMRHVDMRRRPVPKSQFQRGQKKKKAPAKKANKNAKEFKKSPKSKTKPAAKKRQVSKNDKKKDNSNQNIPEGLITGF